MQEIKEPVREAPASFPAVATLPTWQRDEILRSVRLNAGSKDERTGFVLCFPGGERIELPTQDGKLLPKDDLTSYVNREVEVRGEEDGRAFRLVEIRKLG